MHEADGGHAHWSDAPFAAVQTFFLEPPTSASVPTPLPLVIGRVLAPLSLATAAIRALSVQLADLVDGLRARSRTDHIVIVGLNAAAFATIERMGDAAARRRGGVVVLERDPHNPRIGLARVRLVPVVVGDGRFPDDLRRAGVDRAARLVTLAGTPGNNAAIAGAVSAVVAHRRTRTLLRSHIEIDDPRALADLQRAAPFHPDHAQEFFSLQERAARLVARRVTDGASLTRERRLVVSGGGHLSQHLVAQLAREHFTEVYAALPDGSSRDVQRLVVRVLCCTEAEARAIRTVLTPALAAVLDLEAVIAPDPDLHGVLSRLAVTQPTHVIVADDDEIRRMRVQLCLDDLSPLRDVDRVVVAGAERHLESLLAAPRGARRSAVVLPDDVCDLSTLLDGRLDDIARSIHERYLRSSREEQLATADAVHRRVDAGWDQLDEDVRRLNVAAALGLVSMLNQEGLRIVPLRDITRAREPLAEGLVDRLAPVEHERWRRARFGDRPPTPHEPRNRPWAEALDDHDHTRKQLRATHQILAFAGLQVDDPRET